MSIRSVKHLEDILSNHGVRCVRLPVGDDAYIIVTDYGGRIFGPLSDSLQNMDWWPAPDELRCCLQNGTWNIGGERIWIAPEAIFNYTDPERIVDTYSVSPALDPAKWTITTVPLGLMMSLEADIPLAGSNHIVGIRITRHINPLPDRAGYSQEIVLEQTSGEKFPLVPWVIRQVVPGGNVVMAASPGASGATVFGKAPHAAIFPSHGRWQVSFSGPGFFKTIYHRDAVAGGSISYVPDQATGMHRVTIIPRFAAAEYYPEMLPRSPSSSGQCISLFYDEGQFGAYGEIELYGHQNKSGQGVLHYVVIAT